MEYCGENLSSVLYTITKGAKFKIEGNEEQKKIMRNMINNLSVVSVSPKQTFKTKAIVFQNDKIVIKSN